MYLLCILYLYSSTIGTRISATAEIAGVGGQYAVQDHSRSQILSTIESPYATSYYWIILTYILSRTVFQLSRGICQIIAFDKGVSLVNALILGNLIQYHHTLYIVKKTRFLGYIFVSDSLDLLLANLTRLALNVNTFSVITQRNGHTLITVIQGYQFWYKSIARMHFLLVSNTNWHPFLSYCRLFVFFSLSTGSTFIYHTCSGWTPKLRITKFGVKKRETSFYRMVEKYFDILNRLGVDHEWDGQMDG